MNDNTTQDTQECLKRIVINLYCAGTDSTDKKNWRGLSYLEYRKCLWDEALAAINLEFDGVVGNDETHNRLHHRVIDNGCTAECGAGIANELRAKQRQAWYGTTDSNGDNNV